MLTRLAKSVLVLLGLATVTSATDAAIQKKIRGSGEYGGFGFTTLIISNEQINDIIKTAISLEVSGCLIKDITIILKRKQENKEVDFLECL